MNESVHVVVYLGPEDQHWFGPDGTEFHLRSLAQMRDSKEILYTAYPPGYKQWKIKPPAQILSYCMSIHGMEIAATNLYETMKRIDDFKKTFQEAYYNRDTVEIEEVAEYEYRPYNTFVVTKPMSL